MEYAYNTSLHTSEKHHMIQRFPSSIKLSYETIAHKKVTSDYSICVAIPYGRKAYMWWTYYKNNLVCCLLELNRTNTIGENVSFVNAPSPKDFELGTIISGVLVDDSVVEEEDDSCSCSGSGSGTSKKTFQYFLVDDIYMYKGQIMNKFQPQPFQQKLGYMIDLFKHIRPLETAEHHIYLDYHTFWKRDVNISDDTVPQNISIPYNIRYIQYRNIHDILPNINVSIHKKPVWNPVIVADDVWNQAEKPCIPNWTLDLHKHLYKQPSLFWVKADMSHDMYYLYAKDSQKKPTIYQYAFVPNYKTSVMLNQMFRTIKENENIDYIEESDDEDTYEDICHDKFVDLHKMVLMECLFDRKFRKWIPVREASSNLEIYVPYINQLVIMKQPSNTNTVHRHTNNPSHNQNRPNPQNRSNQPNRSNHHNKPSYNQNRSNHHKKTSYNQNRKNHSQSGDN